MSPSVHEAPAAAPVDVVVEVEAAAWAAEPAAETVVRRAIAAAASLARVAPTARGEVSVVLTDDAAIRALNREWRDIDKPTNVLSFPARASSGRPASTPLVLLGDIVIAYQTTAREAAAEEKPFAHHLAHLAVHGFLHLIGYDHDSDREADAMEQLEATILARLGVPDPYLTRAAGA